MVCALYFRIVTFTWTCNKTVNLSKDFYNFYYNITGFTYWNICNFITDVTNFSYFIINIVLTHNILLYVSTLYVFQFSMRQQEWSLEIYELSLSNRINPHSMGRVTKREGELLSSVIQRIHTRLFWAPCGISRFRAIGAKSRVTGISSTLKPCWSSCVALFDQCFSCLEFSLFCITSDFSEVYFFFDESCVNFIISSADFRQMRSCIVSKFIQSVETDSNSTKRECRIKCYCSADFWITSDEWRSKWRDKGVVSPINMRCYMKYYMYGNTISVEQPCVEVTILTLIIDW